VLINTQAFLLNRFRYTAAYWRENANYSYPLHLYDVSDEGDPQKRWSVSHLLQQGGAEPLLALPNVTDHPSMASVPTSRGTKTAL